MTKNGRRALFLLVATLANMLFTLILIAALVLAWILLSQWLKIPNTTPVPWLVAFVVAVVLSGFVYSKALKAIQKRPELCERFGLIKDGGR
jgi:hypothetical protein